jgi:hypothetical protein
MAINSRISSTVAPRLSICSKAIASILGGAARQGIQGRTRPFSTNCSGSPLGRSGPIGGSISSSSVPKPLFSGTDPDLNCSGVFCPELGAHAMADVESRRRFAISLPFRGEMRVSRARMELRCPSCESTDLKKVALAYQRDFLG